MLILEGKVSFQIKTLGKTLRGIPTNSTSGFYLYICFYLYISIYRSIAQSQHNYLGLFYGYSKIKQRKLYFPFLK